MCLWCLAQVLEKYESVQKNEAFAKALVLSPTGDSPGDSQQLPSVTLQFQGERALRWLAELGVGMLYVALGAAPRQPTDELMRSCSTNAPMCLLVSAETRTYKQQRRRAGVCLCCWLMMAGECVREDG